MEMEKRFLEISQATNPNGRRRVKIVLHEIYPDNTRWNINGISYLEQYTRDNADIQVISLQRQTLLRELHLLVKWVKLLS